MAGETIALRIPYITDDRLFEAIDTAPTYDAHVARAIKRAIRAIHGLEALHERAILEELEVYLGRATESTVVGRMKSHHKKKGHGYALILFKTDPDRVEALEQCAINVITKLKRRGKLCVANANVVEHRAGKRPRADEDAVVYMTWRINEDAPVETDRPTVNDIREIATEIAEDVEGVRRQQIESGLAAARAPRTNRDRIRWMRD